MAGAISVVSFRRKACTQRRRQAHKVDTHTFKPAIELVDTPFIQHNSVVAALVKRMIATPHVNCVFSTSATGGQYLLTIAENLRLVAF